MLYSNLSTNNNGHLCFAGLDCVELAKEFGTPAYILDEDKIIEQCKLYMDALKQNLGESSFPLFAGKALCFKELYRVLKDQNMGIDVVSSGEIFTAKQAGFPMEKAFFHGNNKTEADINFAIENGVGFFVCDNIAEVKSLNTIAQNLGITQKVILRLTPGIDTHTHEKINTGKVDSKFGAAIETGQADELVNAAINLSNICLEGFHCHIGSQIFEVEPFLDAAKIMTNYVAEVKSRFGVNIKILNLGGGMAVRYKAEDPKIDYAKNIKLLADTIKQVANETGIDIPSILLEPGRSIVAEAGITLYTVGHIKEIPGLKTYVSVDGGMTDNPRYALYQAPYTIYNANRAFGMEEKVQFETISSEPKVRLAIAGRCCESGDLIQEDVEMSLPLIGDILAVVGTGAYNYSMASNYNALPKPPIVMIKNKTPRVAVCRQTFDDLISNQI